MAFPRMASTRPRLLQMATVCLSAAVMFNTTGCSHRRSAMRPVYGTPVPAESGTIVTDEPVDAGIPPALPKSGPVIDREIDKNLDKDPELAPIKPQKDSSVKPSRNNTTPPAATDLNEPDLNVAPERKPKANIIAPPLESPNGSGPAASRGTGIRTSSRVRRTSMQDTVRPFVNDADDLFQPPKADRSWKYIVVHHSANATGSYDQIDREHRKIQGWDGCGYHFVIGNGSDSPDGQIEVARRWANQKHGLHCRNGKNPDVNEFGIGICLIGDLDKSPPTPKQIAAARALVAYLAERYDIPTDAVGTHAELAESPTACPGKHFPEEQIFGSKHLAKK